VARRSGRPLARRPPADGAPAPCFSRYIGIDYSGAGTPTDSLSGLRAYVGTPKRAPTEALPPSGRRKYWTRRGLAEWLVEILSERPRTIVGIDHAFSFPLAYFDKYKLARDWPAFLDDFHRHWPTDRDHCWVDFVRYGAIGKGKARYGHSRWRRLVDIRARAKSPFHFDAPGTVGKSTHAGLPWLRYIRAQLGDRVHFWPFDGWKPTRDRHVIAEAYPSLWNRSFPRGTRTADAHDAYVVAASLRNADADGSLESWFRPALTPDDRRLASIEGWILGFDGDRSRRGRNREEDSNR
jgi:hypothetical protein